MVFQCFSMVANHWSDDGMVTIHRSGLLVMVKSKVAVIAMILVVVIVLVTDVDAFIVISTGDL